MLRIINHKDAGELLAKRSFDMTAAEEVVRPIIDNVRRRGDAAVREYARQFDGFEGEALTESTGGELQRELECAVEVAAENIRQFAKFQLPKSEMIECPDGRRLGQIVKPLGSMGAYIPAGRYPLLSTLLMTVIPAQVAGVENISIVCPHPNSQILALAKWLDIHQVLQVGGAHAIAALAYGTESISKVDRIVGPGNIYVAAAKKLVSGDTGIDFVAGPTEVVIIATVGNPSWIAADLLAQAEHDPQASAILLTTSQEFAESVSLEVERQLATLSTAKTAQESLEVNGYVVVFDDIQRAVEFSNQLAPEHLSLHDADLLHLVESAGSVFLGANSPEAAGDYATGPNHVLPTAGVARLRGGLSAADFVKVITVQELTAAGLQGLAPSITLLARTEGLEAHARSVEVRLA